MNTQTRDISSTAAFKAFLKKHSLKATPQRLAVHEAMLSLGHACADQVCEWIGTHGKCRITVASVYNILSQMALLGIYGHRLSANNKMYFDVNTYKHLHLYDTVNNDYRDILDDDLIEMVETKVKGRRFRGFKVDGVDILLLCHPSTKKTTQKC